MELMVHQSLMTAIAALRSLKYGADRLPWTAMLRRRQAGCLASDRPMGKGAVGLLHGVGSLEAGGPGRLDRSEERMPPAVRLDVSWSE